MRAPPSKKAGKDQLRPAPAPVARGEDESSLFAAFGLTYADLRSAVERSMRAYPRLPSKRRVVGCWSTGKRTTHAIEVCGDNHFLVRRCIDENGVRHDGIRGHVLVPTGTHSFETIDDVPRKVHIDTEGHLVVDAHRWASASDTKPLKGVPCMSLWPAEGGAA